MKTFAHINTVGDIVGIGMIYFEDGNLTPEVAALSTLPYTANQEQI